MSFDNLCKLLAEKHPQQFATWILGESPPSLKVLKTELSIEPIRADSVIFLQTAGQILHLEFQVEWRSNPPHAPAPVRLLGTTASAISDAHHPSRRRIVAAE